jgi:hypothetical protein
MTVKEGLHHLIEELPETDLSAAERMLRGLKLPAELPVAPRAAETPEKRRQRVYTLAGKYADSLSPVDEFLARKQRPGAWSVKGATRGRFYQDPHDSGDRGH